MIWLIISLLILVFLSAFFSASEIAIFSLSKTRLKSLVNKGLKSAKTLEQLKKDPRKLLIAILIGNNLVNISASSLATALAITLFGSIGVGIATGIMTLAILMFGEIVPKAYATQHAEHFSLKTAKIYYIILKLLYPFIFVFDKITSLMMFSEKYTIAKQSFTEEELKAMLDMSAEAGHMLPEEKELIENILKFNDITVDEVKTNRDDMFIINGQLTVDEAIKKVQGSGFSRFPVYLKSKEDIIGLVHIKDLFFALSKNKKNKRVKNFAKPALFVPQQMVLDKLFKEFQKKRMHMAIVVNDYGEIVGLVTLEDLLEEIVGEIVDETDVTKHLIKQISPTKIVAEGNAELKFINSMLKTSIPGKPNDSISKVVLKKLKRIPSKGEEILIDGCKITVTHSDKRRIHKVSIEKTA